MTADGTYRFARAGETVTTAAELDALPVDSVVLDIANVPRTKRRADSVMGAGWTHAGRSPLSSEMLADGHPLTVLFRPDAPQPATGDAVDRAAREEAGRRYGPGYGMERDGFVAGALWAALAAARAGEADAPRPKVAGHDYAWHDGPAAGYRCSCGTWTKGSLWDHLADAQAAQRGGEAVDREAVRSVISPALQSVEEEAARYGHSAGIGSLSDAATDAVLAFLAARGDAAPGVSVEQVHAEAERRYPRGDGLYPGADRNADARRAFIDGAAWREVQP